MGPFSKCLVVAQRPILPEVGRDQRQGVEYNLGCIALNRADYKPLLAILEEMAGGDIQNDNYLKARVMMEKSLTDPDWVSEL
ncbi:hypothetical protein [Larkinella rosea]|uniref:Uncharacterized protein n=1 Tax=Larkinella rosea TaxID=2025312 RepID=A0A3P1C458_9BACT|nr:hypothetical protein [Larkinella rosea]RRB07856.1 hypothetical protein EHT25_08795 [Larkinella rosea]